MRVYRPRPSGSRASPALSQVPVTVRAVDGEAEIPRVTPAMLRRADTMCRRRLAREYAGGKRNANKSADARFSVSNRLSEDARLAQTELGPPRPEAFVDPTDLEPEQRVLYRAATRGYLATFGDRSGVSADLGWRTHLDDVGVDLVADIGIAIELPDGGRELRRLQLGSRHAASPLLDDAQLRFALVRTEEWAPEQLSIIAADVIERDTEHYVPDLPAARADARSWITERVALVQQLAIDGRARAGADCMGCPFIAGCDQFRS
jgi:hypothetical protein